MISPDKAAERWQQGMQGAGQKYTEGIQGTTENPMEKAAQNQAGYVNGVMEAANSGKWAAGLRRVSLQQWKDQAIKVGAQRLATGAIAARPKMQAFLAQFLPHLESGVARVRSMPASNYEERKQRAVAMMDHNHSFRRS